MKVQVIKVRITEDALYIVGNGTSYYHAHNYTCCLHWPISPLSKFYKTFLLAKYFHDQISCILDFTAIDL